MIEQIEDLCDGCVNISSLSFWKMSRQRALQSGRVGLGRVGPGSVEPGRADSSFQMIQLVLKWS